jgi:hypothetical protein
MAATGRKEMNDFNRGSMNIQWVYCSNLDCCVLVTSDKDVCDACEEETQPKVIDSFWLPEAVELPF